jgi:hypothetical protein
MQANSMVFEFTSDGARVVKALEVFRNLAKVRTYGFCVICRCFFMAVRVPCWDSLFTNGSTCSDMKVQTTCILFA